ncbi:hypothetical protein RRV45_05660 [Bacillus sp. DTU_2020_1000418_1_SI_GHA_SEK_038]|uniref:hypothetical protein n=1 Tax=Bacillus sp. DTU_2020_1000418_1_SI_GHA_SEK_038 TaxID=3077585 RepID=UPI0028E37023|nr:hypothetical protein [Bacillus sp. DTU_2020_1000418_1_SI_GHA_SEK_038]WNS76496.1 hypothetical protein RRV45_05660 [Bacillus sp. DTU_2020_1000418_1_SI_GHA_SEK_038]
MELKAFNEFLYLHKILPFKENEKWKKITTEYKFKTREELKVHNKEIGRKLKEFGFNKGLYIYVNSKSEILYIGKGVNKGKGILERIKSYSEKACIEDYVPKRKRHENLMNLFRTNFGEISIFVYNIENEYEAIAIEAMLTRVLDPLYVDKYLQNNF